jgi:uncharacterized protein (TIGR02145 family)
MRRLLIFLFFSGFVYNVAAQQLGTFKDPRDGKTYKTTKIGTQTWMAENLSFKVDSGCWIYNNDLNYLKIYGYLYNYESAKKACPLGWHLPSNDEWAILENYLGGGNIAGEKLIKCDTTKWVRCVGLYNDQLGFSALPSGSYEFDEFEWLGFECNFWTTTIDAWWENLWILKIDLDGNIKRKSSFISQGYSVRCLKD